MLVDDELVVDNAGRLVLADDRGPGGLLDGLGIEINSGEADIR